MRRRGNTTARGYGRQHQLLRARWAPLVAAGTVDCARCGKRIRPGTPWHLGHDDNDRRKYKGPEHEACNVGAANRGRARRPDPEPREWTEW